MGNIGYSGITYIYIYTVLAGGLTYVFCPFWWSALTGWYFAGIETTNQRIMEISSHSTLGDFGGKQVQFFVLFSQHPGNIFLPLTLCWVTSYNARICERTDVVWHPSTEPSVVIRVARDYRHKHLDDPWKARYSTSCPGPRACFFTKVTSCWSAQCWLRLANGIKSLSSRRLEVVHQICGFIPYIHHGFWGLFNMKGGWGYYITILNRKIC